MRHILGSALPIIALLLIWQYSVEFQFMSPRLISSPNEILDTLIAKVSDGTLLYHSVASLKRLFIGILIGAPIASLIAIILIITNPKLVWLEGTLSFLSQIPPVAWVPVTIAIAGIGEASKIMLVVIVTFFLILLNTLIGCRQISPEHKRVLQLYRHSALYDSYRFYFLGSSPYFLNGLKLSITIGWIVLIAVELVGSSNGLGWYVWDARNFGRTGEMMTGIVLLGILGLMSMAMIGIIEKWALRWQGNNIASFSWGLNWWGRKTQS